MDYVAKLNSPSVREQAEAAMFLRAEGLPALVHVPLLFEKCRAIDTSRELDRQHEGLVGLGAMTLASLIAESGFNDSDPLHKDILNWLIQLIQAKNINVAGHSAYALGSLGFQAEAARKCLQEIVVSSLRGDEHEHISLRAVALRLLRRIDPTLAATFAKAPAFQEYLHAVEHWLATGAAKHSEARQELECELEWLREIENPTNSQAKGS